MRYHEIVTEALERGYDKPLVRVVGQDFSDTFLHGTAKKNLKSLAAIERPEGSEKQSRGGESLFNYLFPPEVNEFGAELYLSEPRQPQQANMFSQGRGNTLAVVRLKPGTRILDLSDEATRAPQITFGNEPSILRFFHRPAITDDMIEFQWGRVYPGYKERYPDWKERIAGYMDPDSPNFSINTWETTLIPYAHARGFGAVRFADEILLVDRAAIQDVRPAKPKEKEAAQTTRTYPGARTASLFTDKQTGAHDEYDAYHRSKSESQPTNEMIEEEDVWHGSAQAFDRFSRMHIGSGEGATAYGWGLYFAGKKEVADFYRQELARKYGGKGYQYHVRIPPDDTFLLWDVALSQQPPQVRRVVLRKYEYVVGKITVMQDPKATDPRWSWKWQWSNGKKLIMRSSAGSEEEAKAEANARRPTRADYNAMTGEEFYQALRQAIAYHDQGWLPAGSDSYAHMASFNLLKSGINGIKYLDAGSRGPGAGTYNYVVFDDTVIEVLGREG